MSWILLRGGHVLGPADQGVADLLIVGREIVAIGANLPLPTGIGHGKEHDVSGRIVLPGLIDGHVHVMGGSGLGGPTTRSTDLQIEHIVSVGVTTVASPLGTDSLSRSVVGLLARAAALRRQGITAYCYTGGWRSPVPTITGDPQGDVALVDQVVGIKVAISEPTAPAYTIEELCCLAHAAWTGGRMAGKRAVLHAHVGDNPAGLGPLREVRQRTGIPADRLVATHVSRNPNLWKQALAYALEGGSIDVTGTERPEEGFAEAVLPAAAILDALASGVAAARITLSSDSGVPYTRVDQAGTVVGQHMVGPGSILRSLRELVAGGLTWGQAAAFATENVANLLGLDRKGRLAPGADADVLVLNSDGAADRVYAYGAMLVEGGRALVRGSSWGSAMA
jgi:beta-aspartyl-dipeptidase (metallo-type)